MYQKTVLDNGIRIVTEQMPGVRSISIGLVLEVGSRDEAAEVSGVAHCIEHMLFKGTSSRDAASLARMMDTAGGQMGAFTARDYTCLYAAVLDDYRTFALDIFGDILLHSLFEAESLRREQAVIFQELESGEEQPGKLVQELLKQQAWRGYSLGQNIYGNRDSVAALTTMKVVDFFKDHYGADRLIISAAGNLDHDDFVSQVNDVFWSLPKARLKATASVEPEFQGRITLRQRDSAHVYFALGAPAPAYTAEERYATFVLNTILGASISSRLFRRMRDEQGWVYEIGSNYHPYRDAGMFIVEGFTTPQNLLPVMESVLSELIGLIAEPVDQEELWRAKEYMRGEILISAEASNTRMSQLATQELYFGRFLSLDELVEGIRSVDAAQVQALASSLFQPGGLALAAVGAFQDSSLLEKQLADLIGL
ncbi:MAG TPA: pitrilysin family protein [Chloroflexia bacterium]|nr:pitrilysin family protein [Chloroflexia bacterium]